MAAVWSRSREEPAGCKEDASANKLGAEAYPSGGASPVIPFPRDGGGGPISQLGSGSEGSGRRDWLLRWWDKRGLSPVSEGWCYVLACRSFRARLCRLQGRRPALCMHTGGKSNNVTHCYAAEVGGCEIDKALRSGLDYWHRAPARECPSKPRKASSMHAEFSKE